MREARKQLRLKRVRECTCAHCRPRLWSDPDPLWGFDRALVPQTKCLICLDYIGGEPYEVEPTFAKNGSMCFVHARCETPEMRRQREDITKRWIAKGGFEKV